MKLLAPILAPNKRRNPIRHLCMGLGVHLQHTTHIVLQQYRFSLSAKGKTGRKYGSGLLTSWLEINVIIIVNKTAAWPVCDQHQLPAAFALRPFQRRIVFHSIVLLLQPSVSAVPDAASSIC